VNGPDVGREATYAAEEDAFGGTDLDAATSLEALVALAKTITAGEWWRACGAPTVLVEASSTVANSSSARSAGPAVVVRLAGGQRTPGTLTHELAHALAGVAAGHDDVFRAAHVDVVALLAGADAAGDLGHAYAVAGLAIEERRWPAPIRGTGDGFAIIP
jgi:hypothetical protein